MATKPTQSVSLVKFQGEYFPYSEVDYRFLRDKGVSVFRISESTLDILSKVLLKGVKIEKHPWGQVYPTLIESFKSGLSSQFDEEVYDFKHEKNWLMIKTDLSDEDTKEERVNTCSRFCNQLSEFMGRYGIRSKSEVKNRDGYTLTRIVFDPDENIIPSFYFGCREDYHAPMHFDFHLSPSARLRFSKRLNLNNEPTLAVAFEDKFGDHWQEAFSRGFPFNTMKAKDCEAAIAFFVSLHNRLTIKKK